MQHHQSQPYHDDFGVAGKEDVHDIALDAPSNNDGNQLPSVEDVKTENAMNGGGASAMTSAKRRSMLLGISFAAGLAIIVIILVSALSGKPSSSGGSDNSTSNTRGFVSNKLTTSDEGQYLIENLYNGKNTVFQDLNSPQSKALEWMIEENKYKVPDLASHPYPFVQRYVVGVFVYSVVPNSAVTEMDMMDPTTSECKWNAMYEDVAIEDEDTRNMQAREMGFGCDGNNHIRKIEFQGLGLAGTLPIQELEQLTSLRHLALDKNALEPEGFKMFPIIPSLRHVSMARNLLKGTLPDNIGELTNLIVLALSDNEITGGIPSSISSCTDLKVIALDNNQLETGFLYLETLTMLREIHLGNNLFFENIGDQTLKNLVHLEVLSIHNNQFAGPLPSVWFTDLHKLEHLDAHKNAIGGSEPWSNDDMIDYKGVLHYIDLKSNLLFGTLPRSFQFLSNHLVHLDVSSNRLSNKIPHTFTHLKKLRVLMLNDFGLGDLQPVPEWLSGLDRLRFLGLQATGLSGTIPTFFGSMEKLEMLDLDYNNLNGTIPSELGALPNLSYLQLNQNRLTGEVPPEVFNKPDLHLLTLDNNEITGMLGPPDETGDCPVDIMTADCGNEDLGCPYCEGQKAVQGKKEIDCPCCTRCCYDSPDDEACGLSNWLDLIENDSDAWEDVRLKRQASGFNINGYYYLKRYAAIRKVSGQ